MASNGQVDRTEVTGASKAAQEAEDCGRLVEVSRLEKGWTSAQLAEAAGVTESDVVQFESGRTTPVEPTLSRFLRAMGYVS
ncbi:helix-turn-helix domain-containing protein [Actinokineospora sp. 24-640]